MQNLKLSFSLPPRLAKAFDREVRRRSLPMKRALAAALLRFLELSRAEQAASLARLPDDDGDLPRRARDQLGEALRVEIPSGGRVIG